jgi:NAD(P)-dependent dehydrogenase (short-subunit alcohol dehydrogenase family)
MYLQTFTLPNRTAVVTGGGRAIGLACVEALAEAGARVVIADYDSAIAEEGRDAMRAKGYAVEIAILDVTDPGAVNAAADEIAARHGASIFSSTMRASRGLKTPAEAVADEHWLNVVDVNLNGTFGRPRRNVRPAEPMRWGRFWCCRAFGRHMLAAGRGAVVNVGSMSGFIVNRPQPQSCADPAHARSAPSLV